MTNYEYLTQNGPNDDSKEIIIVLRQQLEEITHSQPIRIVRRLDEGRPKLQPEITKLCFEDPKQYILTGPTLTTLVDLKHVLQQTRIPNDLHHQAMSIAGQQSNILFGDQALEFIH
ncbi:hypothetical protein H4R33_006855 [Dimargaris cristalligena]|nr:hypothetical protein H4R33_006855 [Dimargaris cristalligena]